MHTCGKLFYSLAFGIDSSDAKVAELKRLSVANKSPRKAKEPDLVRLPTRSENECPGAAAGKLLAKRVGCGREEDGREEGAVAPLEALRALLLVAGDRVASAVWRLLAKLFKEVSKRGRSQMESVSSAQTIEKR